MFALIESEGQKTIDVTLTEVLDKATALAIEKAAARIENSSVTREDVELLIRLNGYVEIQNWRIEIADAHF